jgi:hypothetical protein
VTLYNFAQPPAAGSGDISDMSLNSKSKSLAATTLGAILFMGTVVVPNVAMAAFDSPAPIEPAAPAQSAGGDTALSGNGGAVLSGSGGPVKTGAWCDPVSNSCERHPWSNTARGNKGKDRGGHAKN